MPLLAIKRELDVISIKVKGICRHKRIASSSQMRRTSKKKERNSKSAQRHGGKS